MRGRTWDITRGWWTWGQQEEGGTGCSTALSPTTPKFEGKCTELKGHIYDCSDSRQSDKFTKTTKEIAEYVGRTYKYGGDIRVVVNNLEEISITEPTDPPDGATNADPNLGEASR
jgi:cytochrome c biogenesis protein ResB